VRSRDVDLIGLGIAAAMLLLFHAATTGFGQAAEFFGGCLLFTAVGFVAWAGCRSLRSLPPFQEPPPQDSAPLRPLVAGWKQRFLEDGEGWRRAGEMILRVGDADPQPFLLQVLDGPCPRRAEWAAEELGRRGDSAVIPRLCHALAHSRSRVRAGAAVGLAHLAASRVEELSATVPQLASALGDRRHRVRTSAAWALYQYALHLPHLDFGSAVPDLRRHAEAGDDDDELRELCCLVLQAAEASMTARGYPLPATGAARDPQGLPLVAGEARGSGAG
jgi:hypothetical protein